MGWRESESSPGSLVTCGRIRSQRAPRSSEEEHGVRKRVGRLLSHGRRWDGEKANPPPAVCSLAEGFEANDIGNSGRLP